MFELNIILYTIIVIPYTIVYIKKYKLTPVSFFLVMEISYFYGICFAPKGQLDVAVKLETIYVVAMVSFILGVEFCKRIRFKSSNHEGSFVDSDLNHNQRLVVWFIIWIAILACAYLFAVGGINVFLRSLLNFFSDSSAIYKNERASYFAVGGMGYIYQFRAILLPILTVYMAYCDRKKLPKVLSIPLTAVMVIFLLGTGQRNAFVFFCLVVLMYAIVMHFQYRIQTFTKTQLIVLGSASALFLIVLTISNGRVSGNGNQVTGAIQSLLDRALSVNQRTAITAFTYIDTQPTSWGYDWLMMMRDILPGKSGYLSLARITYYMAYGTYNGTGSPCLWGSGWYNFQIFGITVFPFIVGICYHKLYKTMIHFPNKNRLYMLIYCGLCVYLGLWVYGTPVDLFNIGVVSLLILRWLVFRVFKYDRNHE